MQRGRMLIVAGALIAAAGLTGPFLRAGSLGTVGGTSTNAWVPAAALAGAALVAIVGDRRERLGDLPAVAATAAVTLALVTGGAVVIDAVAAARDAAALGVAAGFGSGAWMLAGAILIAAAGVGLAIGRRL